jgi:hypothetical protein
MAAAVEGRCVHLFKYFTVHDVGLTINRRCVTIMIMLLRFFDPGESDVELAVGEDRRG